MHDSSLRFTPRGAALASLLVLTLPAGEGLAQSYGVRAQSRPYTSIAGSGTPVGLGGQDDNAARVVLPFDFPYFGRVLSAGSALHVTTNGLLCLDQASTSYSNTTLPTRAAPNGLIAAYWTDLEVPSSTDVYVRSSAGELVVEWADARILGRSETLSMQVVLSPSGEVAIRFGPRTGAGRSATVGLESRDGLQAASAPCGSACTFASVPANSELVFTPGGGGGGDEVTIRTRNLPPAVVGAAYTAQLTAEAPSPPAWSITSGGLPAGLTLSASGAIEGAPLEAATASFTVRAEVAGLPPAETELTLEVTEGGGGVLRLTTSTLPPAEAGVPYEAFFTATGGAPPYAFQIVEGFDADWMVLDPPTGRLSGTPPAPGAHRLRLSVFDSDLNDTEGEVVLEVGAARPLAIVERLPEGRVGRAYDAPLVEGGVPPIMAGVEGEIPSGLRVEEGRLRGQPTAPANVALRVSARDADGAEGSRELRLVITELTPLRVATERLSASINADVNLELQAAGGLPPYAWSLVSGSFPSGLRLEGDRVMGRASSAGSTAVVLAVTDAEASRAEAEVQVSVEAFRSASGRNNRERGGGCRAARASDPGLLGPWLLLLAFVALRRKRI